jgi:hypothetical protein
VGRVRGRVRVDVRLGNRCYKKKSNCPTTSLSSFLR